MTHEEIGWGVKKIVAQVAGLPIYELEADHMLREELMLDSLKELEIVARTEIYFGVSLDEGELMAVRTLREFVDKVVEALESNRSRGEGERAV
jgi:acyl carrier protein